MSKVHTHPGQPEMQVEVILPSQTETGAPPIYTLRMRYPRIIHAEIMTHRLFSRNARSSRAVPVQTMLNEVREKPFVPWHWGKNQKGMQASEECDAQVMLSVRDWESVYEDGREMHSREDGWLWARDKAVEAAEAFMKAGYHKQLPNRLLEPFSWIDTLITSTDWSNFLWLRDHKDAEPHLQDLARLVEMAIAQCSEQTLEPGEWHLPYITENDRDAAVFDHGLPLNSAPYFEWLCKISAARCARISYKPFDGDASYDRELERYNSLVSSDRVHASPLEHQAAPDVRVVCPTTGRPERWKSPHLHGNLEGYVQYRKMVPGERA